MTNPTSNISENPIMQPVQENLIKEQSSQTKSAPIQPIQETTIPQAQVNNIETKSAKILNSMPSVSSKKDDTLTMNINTKLVKEEKKEEEIEHERILDACNEINQSFKEFSEPEKIGQSNIPPPTMNIDTKLVKEEKKEEEIEEELSINACEETEPSLKEVSENEEIGQSNIPPPKDTDFCDDMKAIREHLGDIHTLCQHIVKDHPLYTLATAISAFALQLIFGELLLGLPMIITAIFVVEFLINASYQKERNEMIANFKHDWQYFLNILAAFTGTEEKKSILKFW
jgi:hypothetical protein